MLVYKDGITRDIAKEHLNKWLGLGYEVVTEEKEEPQEEETKPKAKKK